MSIIISDLSFHFPNLHLFKGLNFSAEKHNKLAIIGDNGSGKSTFLRLISGNLEPHTGSIISSSPPYYIPQHTGKLNKTIAEVLGVKDKLTALHSILNGSVVQNDFDILNDDWEIESKCEAAFKCWKISHIDLNKPIDELSGGEKTKVFLSGLLIHNPEIILLDEPTNHLDKEGREILYNFIQESKAILIIVSHDIELLNLLPLTYELSMHGLKRYGGNYSFYQKQKEIEVNALSADIRNEEKAIKLAKKKSQEIRERQEKRLHKGEKNKYEVPRIFRKTLTNSSENTAARLQNKHVDIINDHQFKLQELHQRQSLLKELKIDFDNTSLHPGKILVDAKKINYHYQKDIFLWKNPLDIILHSHDRISISGNNGSGKTTLVKLLTGSLKPSTGSINRNEFRWIYLDQDYTVVDINSTIEELAFKYNTLNMEEHEVKLRLNRFLFPSDTWNKSCKTLSGGEKMRLYLCCLGISNQTPDLIVLDEPTNNLDLSGLEILLNSLKNYKGSLIIISHDSHFTSELGITYNINLND